MRLFWFVSGRMSRETLSSSDERPRSHERNYGASTPHREGESPTRGSRNAVARVDPTSVVATDEQDTGPRPMRLRYAGTCVACRAAVPAGTTAIYDRTSRSVTCTDCATATPSPTVRDDEAEPGPEPPVEAGSAGSSARREYESRGAARENRIREAHPRMGGLILTLTDEPQSTTAWGRGAKGEELLGQGLDSLSDSGVRVLHDRRIPPTKANIDHIAVAPSGVYGIDAKRYKGRPTLRVEGGIIRPRVTRLVVGSRDCTKLVEGVQKQVALVTAALAAAGHADLPVRGMLCFVDADCRCWAARSRSTASTSSGRRRPLHC